MPHGRGVVEYDGESAVQKYSVVPWSGLIALVWLGRKNLPVRREGRGGKGGREAGSGRGGGPSTQLPLTIHPAAPNAPHCCCCFCLSGFRTKAVPTLPAYLEAVSYFSGTSHSCGFQAAGFDFDSTDLSVIGSYLSAGG